MRKMYSKGQIKSLGNGYRHQIVCSTASDQYTVIACLPVASVNSISDMPKGIYLGLKGGVDVGVLDLIHGSPNWCDASGSNPMTITSITDTLLD